jgi:hypothetical protein
MAALGAGDGNIIVFAVRNDMAGKLTESQGEALNALGLKTDFISGMDQYSYIAVIDGKHVQYEKSSPGLLEYTYATENGISFTMTSAGNKAGNKAEILAGGASCSLNKRGVNVAVYNKILQSVIDAVNFDTHAGADGVRK